MVSLGFINTIFSQTVIDYTVWSTSQCNAFNPPATVNGIVHTSTCGRPQYNSTNHDIVLGCNNTSGFGYGTEYKFAFNFKLNYSYSIKINAWAITSSTSEPFPKLRIDFNSASNGSGSANCSTAAESVNTTSALTNTNNQGISTGQFLDYTFPFSSLTVANGFLYVGAIPSLTTTVASIEIKKITITETPPPPTFTLAPATLNVTIGTSVSQTFTVTNVYSTAGVTGYTWNLGATPNGWKYLGAAAPATINTTVNTLALQTDICATTIKSVSAVAKIGAASYTTNSSVVTAVAPVYTITGPARVCAGTTANYSINAPAGSTVNWAVSPAGIVTPPNPATGLSTTLNKVADGTCTLTANVSTNGCASTPFAITLSTASPSTSSVITWTRSSSCSNGFQTWNLTADNTRGSNWLWSVGSLSVNSQILIFNPNGSQTLADVKGSGAIKLNYTDICGVATQDGITVFTTCPPSFLVAPNPSTDLVTVSTDNTAAAKTASATSIYSIKITDRMGGVRKLIEYKTPVKSAGISITGIEAGIYSISIFDGSQWGTQELIIK